MIARHTFTVDSSSLDVLYSLQEADNYNKQCHKKSSQRKDLNRNISKKTAKSDFSKTKLQPKLKNLHNLAVQYSQRPGR